MAFGTAARSCSINAESNRAESTVHNDAWLAIAEAADWKTPEDAKQAHPKAGVLKGGRVVFNIKANDFRLIALVQYVDGALMIRFLGSHKEYDGIDAETV